MVAALQRSPISLSWEPAQGVAELVGTLATSRSSAHHELSDDSRKVSYRELPEIFDRFDVYFSRQGVTADRPLALECSQSIPGALALIYFMSRGYDLVLLPELGAQSKEVGTPRFIPSFCPSVVTALSAPAESDADAEATDDLTSALRIETNTAYVEEPAVVGANGPNLYLRTSGSTGQPKLARMSHRKWFDNALGCNERWGLVAGDRLAVPVPIFHSYGFGAAFLPGLVAGASMDIQGSFNILKYLEREARFEPNVAFLTPALCDMFVKVRRSPRTYKLAVTAGDKVKRETMVAFEPRFGPLLNLYGSAEMGAVSSASPSDPPEQRLATAGYPLPGIELRLDEDGTLACKQRHGFDGYLIQDDAWRFHPRNDDQWFRTGDLARLRDDGYLEIAGRSGLSIKRDGLLVVFADIETAMEKIAGLERVVVFAHGESRRGRGLVAACVKNGAAPEVAAIRRHCKETLPLYAVPDEIVLLDSLPLLPNGKIDRQALPHLI